VAQGGPAAGAASAEESDGVLIGDACAATDLGLSQGDGLQK